MHFDDLADLYVRALEAPPGTLLVAASETHRVRDFAAALGNGKVQSLLPDEAFKIYGPWVECLLLDSRVSGKRARGLLGWIPRAIRAAEPRP